MFFLYQGQAKAQIWPIEPLSPLQEVVFQYNILAFHVFSVFICLPKSLAKWVQQFLNTSLFDNVIRYLVFLQR